MVSHSNHPRKNMEFNLLTLFHKNEKIETFFQPLSSLLIKWQQSPEERPLGRPMKLPTSGDVS